MLTFSIINGEDISTSYDLSEFWQLQNLLSNLKDNDDGFIEPFSIRDSILTIFSNTPFKETYIGTYSYIGIDTLNEDNRDNKVKINIGKRSYSGNKKYENSHDIISSTLIDSNNDVFLYNTKNDTNNDQHTTKIKILTGTNSNSFDNSPYISNVIVNKKNNEKYQSLNIISNDSINIISSTVSLNNIEISTNANDGYVFVKKNDKPVFGDPNNEEINILFSDSRWITQDIGDIKKGDSFDDVNIKDILLKILYPGITNSNTPYQQSIGDLEFLTYYDSIAEIGTYPTPTFKFTINKGNLPLKQTILVNMLPNFIEPITTYGYQTIVGTASSIKFKYPVNKYNNYEYSIIICDETKSENFTKNLILHGVYPYFYGTTNIIKKVNSKTNNKIEFTESGYIHYMYPSEYNTLSNIMDEQGDDIISQFTYSTIMLNSPENYWSNKLYYSYKSINEIEINNSLIYRFNHN